jgi:hypothetical protein
MAVIPVKSCKNPHHVGAEPIAMYLQEEQIPAPWTPRTRKMRRHLLSTIKTEVLNGSGFQKPEVNKYS